MTITLPWPPSTNTSYSTYKGRRIKSKKAREYTQTIQTQLTNNPNWTAHTQTINPTTQIHINIQLHPPDKRKRDINNYDKILIDAIFQTLNADDHQITQLNLTKHPPQPPGHVTLTLHHHTHPKEQPCPNHPTGPQKKSKSSTPTTPAAATNKYKQNSPTAPKQPSKPKPTNS